ncbi:type VI secretion system tube protein TssD [Pedobacter ginsenosidimutans]|uniref:type VI secretion system tube protein TssD n=1 Tax=Pedobacter ginsenosidimutans TaxID=687842 RepID=UPI000A71B332|nr:type VI secretion system tube protein TssD [Pedobacter ginsenosidimutans]
MAFKARLNFSGKEYQVLQYAYVFNRDVDLFGSFCSTIHSANITIRSGENLD